MDCILPSYSKNMASEGRHKPHSDRNWRIDINNDEDTFNSMHQWFLARDGAMLTKDFRGYSSNNEKRKIIPIYS
jgi:hypothetical protein